MTKLIFNRPNFSLSVYLLNFVRPICLSVGQLFIKYWLMIGLLTTLKKRLKP